MKDKSSHSRTSERIHFWFQGDRALLPALQTSFKLIAARFAHFQLREYFLVSKKLKSCPENVPNTIHHQTERLKPKPEKPLPLPKPKQDCRLFFIDRVIKCLLD